MDGKHLAIATFFLFAGMAFWPRGVTPLYFIRKMPRILKISILAGAIALAAVKALGYGGQ